MFYAALYKMLCMAYGQFLRALVKKAIDDPDSEIDDIASHNGSTIGLKLGGTLVTATAAQINAVCNP